MIYLSSPTPTLPFLLLFTLPSHAIWPFPPKWFAGNLLGRLIWMRIGGRLRLVIVSSLYALSFSSGERALSVYL